MKLARFLNNLIKEDGFVLVDASSKKYLIGKPKKEKILTVKLLDKSLLYKLLIYFLHLPSIYSELRKIHS